MLNKVSTNNAPKAIGPYSQAIIYGNMVYTSGQIALSPETAAPPVAAHSPGISFLLSDLR